MTVKSICSDHERELENHDMDEFCHKEGIHHRYYAAITPHQNGVAERKI